MIEQVFVVIVEALLQFVGEIGIVGAERFRRRDTREKLLGNLPPVAFG